MADRDLSEVALVLFFLVVAMSFIALTTTFRSDSAKLFPRLTGGIIVVGTVLLLVSDRLPGSIRWIVEDSVDLVDRDEFEELETEDPDRDDAIEEREAAVDGDEDAKSLTSRQFTFIAIAGYVGAAYLVSILIATPFFVIAYGYWYRQPWWIVAVLTVLSLAICWAFMVLANAPLDQSMLLPRGFIR